ncbi:MAG TPA: 50S ribosomal protein L21 [Bacillota bacterium]|nr:50S ribosomal protein L21 [Bacillota bacterium]
MFAIIETGGKQYRVKEGDIIRVEKIDITKGDVVEFADVLAVGGDEDVSWGAPTLPGVTVTAKVLDQGRGPKIVVFRYRAKSNHRRRKGHRQPFTAVEIQSINR